MTPDILIEVTRGDDIECVHAGSVAVVNRDGVLLYQAGDPEFLTFTRSTIKPFQAAPLLHGGGVERFGFGADEIALMCASHSGEAVHVSTAQSILDKAGCNETQLRCGCHVPTYFALLNQPVPAAPAFTQLHNNCSGKHAGFLAACVQHGWPLETYLEPSHPLQQQVRRSIAYFADMPAGQMRSGTDGCSAPNYALPLSKLAYAYARLAQGEETSEFGTALETARVAMTTHPHLVSGIDRNDLAFMQTAPDDWVSKTGADGVQVIGIRSAGIGIAVKIADGNQRAAHVAAVAVLTGLDLVGAAESSPLAPWLRPQLRNLRGLPTGEVRAVLKLKKS